MKITKRQLRRIIKEEKAKLTNEVHSDDRYEDPYMDAMIDLYDALEVALSMAKHAGISYEDVMTAFGDAKADTGY